MVRVKWRDVTVDTYGHEIGHKTEVNRLYVIITKTSREEWASIPKRRRKQILSRYQSLKKKYYWGGPRRPYFIKKR